MSCADTVNGWTLTGQRIWKNSWEARHDCGYISGFGSRPAFLSNTKKCRPCSSMSKEQRAVNFHLSIYKYHATDRNIKFDLSVEEFDTFIRKPCYYCGQQPGIRFKKEVWPFSGLDRVDNNGGYTLTNVRPCCRDCNVAKGSMSEDEFIAKITTWYERLVR